jgi:hypothetical protein
LKRPVRVKRPVGQSGGIDGHRILTIVNGGGGTSLLVTTAAPHGLVGGEVLSLSGTSVPGYNTGGMFVLDAPTVVTFHLDVLYIADATGGLWVRTG